MKNLLDQLCNSGLTEAQAQKTIKVVYQWLEEKYPVLGTLAKNTLLKQEMNASTKDEVRDTK